MSTINFLQRDERDQKRAESLRLIVLPITTAVMVTYLVLVSALLGWWWWWSSKQERISAEYTTLKGQVDGKQQAEVLAKRMIDRVKVVNKYMNSRKDIYSQTEFLVDQPFEVINFGLAKEDYFFVDISATESATVKALEGELKNRYENVTVKSMSWNVGSGKWETTYWYKGNKI